jgi:2-methylfumaryl-CoA isomerase
MAGDTKEHRVVIVGAGFAGFNAARELSRLVGATTEIVERLLRADFSSTDDLHTYRDTIAALLAPWFARRTVADLTAALAGTSVAWALLQDLSDAPRP